MKRSAFGVSIQPSVASDTKHGVIRVKWTLGYHDEHDCSWLGTRVSLIYVQLHYNYRDNYYMGKINNFIICNGSLLKGGKCICRSRKSKFTGSQLRSLF